MENIEPSNESINILIARQAFFNRVQQENETFTEFMRSLTELVKQCDFKVMEDEMLRDRLILGIHNPRLRENFILKCNDVTLEHFIMTFQFFEQISLQQLGHNEEMHDEKQDSDDDIDNTTDEEPTFAQPQTQGDDLLKKQNKISEVSDSSTCARVRIFTQKHPNRLSNGKQAKVSKLHTKNSVCLHPLCTKTKNELKTMTEVLKKTKAENQNLLHNNSRLLTSLLQLHYSNQENHHNLFYLSQYDTLVKQRNYGFPLNEEVLMVGDATVKLGDIKRVYDKVFRGVKHDTEFIQQVANLLWSDESFLKCSNEEDRLREFTPEKEKFVGKHLRLRVENEGYSKKNLQIRANPVEINKVLKNYLELKEIRAKWSQRMCHKKVTPKVDQTSLEKN